MARATAKVFLSVHGVEGEQSSGQAKSCDHVLGGGDFIALLGDRQVAENDLAVAGERAQHMRRLAVVEGVKAAAQRLAVNGHADRGGLAFSRGRRQFGRVLAKNPLKLRPVETTQDEPQRGVGRRFAQRYSEYGVQAVKMDLDEGVNLTIRDRSGQHRQDREQQDWRQRIHLPLTAAGIGNLGKQRQQRARHLGNLRGWLLPIDSDKSLQGNRLFRTRRANANHMVISIEQPWGGNLVDTSLAGTVESGSGYFSPIFSQCWRNFCGA